MISPLVHISLSFQLRSINLHGDPDRVWNEVSGDVEHGSPGPGIAELSGGNRLHHQDFRFRDESQPVQLRLLLDRRQSHPPHQVDGLGERSIGEISLRTLLGLFTPDDNRFRNKGFVIFMLFLEGIHD